MAHCYLTCVAVMVQCAAAELHKIRVLWRVPGVNEGGHLGGSELPGNSSMRALTAGAAACSTVGSGFPGSQDWRLRLDEKQGVDVAGIESKGQSTKVGTGEAGWRYV